YSVPEKEAKEKVTGWMEDIGMSVRTDGAGNVFGRYRGHDDSEVFMAGSHLDSVPNGGNFDGVAGVVAAPEVGELVRGGAVWPEKEAKEKVTGWMEDIGMSVRTDGAGNVFGRYRGHDDSEVFMAGSHLDSVPNGGNFDGVAGVLSALEIAELWHEARYTPKYSYEVVIFSDEEGSRFNSGLTGSRAFMGLIDEDELDKYRDPEGRTIDDVLGNIGSDRKHFLASKGQDCNIRM